MISRRQIIRHQLEEDEHHHHNQLRAVSSLGENNHHVQNGNRLDQFDPYSIYGEEDDEEDVWYSEDRLFEDHIQEVIDKWHSIDDEIWAKIICMERNRRIAKAYGRKHVLTINGSHDDYIDGTILGLNSFDNPDRDVKTKHIKQYIGHGVRIKIDDSGDIWVKRLSKCSVYLRKVNNSTALVTTNGNGNSNSNSNNNNSAGNSSSSSDSYMANSSNNSDLNDFYGIVGYPPPMGSSSHNLHNNNNNGSNNGRHSRSNQKVNTTQDLSKQQTNGSKQARHQQSQSNNGNKQQQNGKLSSTNNQFILLNSSGSAGSSASTSASMLNNQTSNNKGKKSSEMVQSNGGGQQQQQKNAGSKLLSGEINSYGSVSLDTDVAHKIFDMEAFKLALAHELRQSCPNRCKLLNCCISIISFVVDDKKLLNLPSWVMIINIVAIDLLKTELGLTDHDLLNPMSPGALLGQPYSASNRLSNQQNQHHLAAIGNSSSSHGHGYRQNGKNRLINVGSQDDVNHGHQEVSSASKQQQQQQQQFEHLRTRITNNHKRNLFNNMMLDDTCLFSSSHNNNHSKQHSFGNNLRSSLSQENLLLGQHQQLSGYQNGSHVNSGAKNGFAAARKAFADAAAAGIYNQVKLTSNGSTNGGGDMMMPMSGSDNSNKNGLARYRNIQIINDRHQCDDNCPMACSQQQQQQQQQHNHSQHHHNGGCLLSRSKHDLTNVDESSEGSCSLEGMPACCCQHAGDRINSSSPQTTNAMVNNENGKHRSSSASCNHTNSSSNNNLSSSSGFESHSSSSTTEQPITNTNNAVAPGLASASLSGADTTSASIYGPIKMPNNTGNNTNGVDIDSSKCCECQQCVAIETRATYHDHDRCCPLSNSNTTKLAGPHRYLSSASSLSTGHEVDSNCPVTSPATDIIHDNKQSRFHLHSAHHSNHNNHHHHHYHSGHHTGHPVEQGANLLLVAPTGLSPQLPTKLPHAPRFSTIQYIDGNGQCNVLHNDIDQQQQQQQQLVVGATNGIQITNNKSQSAKVANSTNNPLLLTKTANNNNSRLPPGIPAHAQLAPPATQKHILRYVMSAVKNVAGTSKQQASSMDKNHSNFTSKQRPLPILPTQQQQLSSGPSHHHSNYTMNQRSNDEEDNLYYCGLQARVPAFRRYPTNGQISSSANINAILTDINGKIVARRGAPFSNSNNQQYNHQMYHSSKHHQHHYQLQQANNLSKSNAVLGPKNRLLLDQLKMLSSVQNHPNVLSSSSNLLSNHHNSLFLSADNLNHAHRSNPLLSTTTASGANSTKKEKKGVKLFSLSSSSSSNQSTDQLASQDQENSSAKQKTSKSTKRTKTTRKS